MTIVKRRNNAPVRPRRPATGVPDFLFGIAAALFAMGALFIFASFFDGSLSEDEAGRALARIFAATLILSALFVGALGILLLRGDRATTDHYAIPAIVGVLVGVLEGYIFLNPGNPWVLLLPLLLFVFVSRGVRRRLSRAVQTRSARRR